MKGARERIAGASQQLTQAAGILATSRRHPKVLRRLTRVLMQVKGLLLYIDEEIDHGEEKDQSAGG